MCNERKKKTHSEVHTLSGEEAALHRLQHYLKPEKAFGAAAWANEARCKATGRHEKTALQANKTFILRKANSINIKSEMDELVASYMPRASLTSLCR